MKRTAPLALLALVASAGASRHASAQSGAAIPLTLTADRGGGQDVVISTGVPFTQGVLRDETPFKEVPIRLHFRARVSGAAAAAADHDRPSLEEVANVEQLEEE